MPLDIWIEDCSKEGDILVDYYTSAGHYPEWEVDAMLSRMGVLMETVLEEAHDQPLGGINILPQEERKLLLETFNDTASDYPRDKTIAQLFEEQVERTPDNIAVVFEDRQLTYRALNESANRVAHYLRSEYQIQSDDIVALQLERSE